jgi:hypothetical protein
MRLIVAATVAAAGLIASASWWDGTPARVASGEVSVAAQAGLTAADVYPASAPPRNAVVGAFGRTSGLLTAATERAAAIPQPSPEMLALQDRLAAAIGGYRGDYAVSVLDLQTGERIDVNGDTRQFAACTNKILIMIALAQDMARGLYAPEDVSGEVWGMMAPSDTPPARSLIQRIGGGDVGDGLRRLNEMAWNLGAEGILTTHPPGYYWEEYGYEEVLGETENWLTANGMNTVLAALYRGAPLPGVDVLRAVEHDAGARVPGPRRRHPGSAARERDRLPQDRPPLPAVERVE